VSEWAASPADGSVLLVRVVDTSAKPFAQSADTACGFLTARDSCCTSDGARRWYRVPQTPPTTTATRELHRDGLAATGLVVVLLSVVSLALVTGGFVPLLLYADMGTLTVEGVDEPRTAWMYPSRNWKWRSDPLPPDNMTIHDVSIMSYIKMMLWPQRHTPDACMHPRPSPIPMGVFAILLWTNTMHL
jgi:hypothetical protein